MNVTKTILKKNYLREKLICNIDRYVLCMNCTFKIPQSDAFSEISELVESKDFEMDHEIKEMCKFLNFVGKSDRHYGRTYLRKRAVFTYMINLFNDEQLLDLYSMVLEQYAEED